MTAGDPRDSAWVVPALLLSAAFAASLVVQSVLFPLFRAPDEVAHVDMSRYVAARLGDGEGLRPAEDVRDVDAQVVEAARRWGLTGVPAELPPLAREDAPRQRPPFSQLVPSGPSGRRNQMTQHPPAYYLLTGAVSGWLESRPPGPVGHDRQVLALRLMGALLVAPLPMLAAWTARRLGAGVAGASAAALVPLGIPMLGHVAASVNNDTLLVAAVAGLTPLLVGVARGRGTWPCAVAIGGLAGVALLAKGFGLFVPAWIALAYALAARSRRSGAPGAAGGAGGVLGQGAVAVALAVLVGGWWWVRNLVVLGEVQPHRALLPVAGESFVPDWGAWTWLALGRFVRRFWIEPDTVQGVAPFEALAMVALVSMVVLGLRRALRRGGLGPGVVALTPVAVLLGLMIVGAVGLYLSTGHPLGIHGRYTYAALAGLAALVGLAADGWRGQAALAALAGAVVAMQAWGLLAALRFYWAGPDVFASARSMLAWSPLPSAVVVVAALAQWALLAAGLVTALRVTDRAVRAAETGAVASPAETAAGGPTATATEEKDLSGRGGP